MRSPERPRTDTEATRVQLDHGAMAEGSEALG